MIVALFAFITFTGKPFDRKKKSDKSVDKRNQIRMTTIAGDVKSQSNGSETENNRMALIERGNEKEAEGRPRARLPGILHFMFET